MTQTIPDDLHQCHTKELQTAWIKRALLAGRTVSDSGLWLAGVDHPEVVIFNLRESGMRIKVTTKKVTDAANEKHQDLAWVLDSDPTVN
jgi:hypothetical protein